MIRIVRSFLAALACLALAGGCGKSGSGGSGLVGPGPGGGGGGPFSFTVDGLGWSGDPLVAGQGASVVSPGAYLVMATRASGSAYTFAGLTLFNIGGTGTYPLGVNATNFGGWFVLGNASAGWWTPLNGSAGTVTITTLTATRIAGTFACVVDSLHGTARGTHVIASGSFDYPILANSVGPLPDHAGSSLAATVDGAYWNAATVFGFVTGSSPTFIVSGGSLDESMSITVPAITGAGTYPIALAGPRSSLGVTDGAAGVQWGGAVVPGPGGTYVPADSGAVVVTSYTATRIKGTFGARLARTAGSGPNKVLTGGSFDIGIPPPAARAAVAGITPMDARLRAIEMTRAAQAR